MAPAPKQSPKSEERATVDSPSIIWGALMSLFGSPEAVDSLTAATEAAGVPHPGALRALLTMTDGAPMRQLAHELSCDASYVTSLADTLEEMGYVVREPALEDRRVKALRLTKAGRQARERARQAFSHAPDLLTTTLSASELDRLAAMLTKLVPVEAD